MKWTSEFLISFDILSIRDPRAKFPSTIVIVLQNLFICRYIAAKTRCIASFGKTGALEESNGKFRGIMWLDRLDGSCANQSESTLMSRNFSVTDTRRRKRRWIETVDERRTRTIASYFREISIHAEGVHPGHLRDSIDQRVHAF